MKIFIDLEKEMIIKTDDEDRTLYRADENADAIKVYFKESPTNWYLSLGATLANGRNIDARYHDGVVGNETIDGVEYYYFTFTLSRQNGFLLVNGSTKFTLYHNTTDTNGKVVRQKAVGTFVINVANTTETENNILVTGEDAGEVVTNVKLLLEQLQAIITNDNNVKSVDNLTARTILTILNDFSSYKVVFGHSYKEDEADLESRKYYLMAVVNKDDASDMLMWIDESGTMYYKGNEILTKLGGIITGNLQINGTTLANNIVAKDADMGVLGASDNKWFQAHIFNLVGTDGVPKPVSEIMLSDEILLLLGEKLDKAGGTIYGDLQVDGTTTIEGMLPKTPGMSFIGSKDKKFSDVHTNLITGSNNVSKTVDNLWEEKDVKAEHQAMTTDLIPDADNTRNLGAVLKAFANVFAKVVKATDVKIGDYYAITTKDKADLQAQIDGINAGQNLADIVGTYALLSSYDTTNLKANDKVQVLKDETKEDDSTVYNWNGTAWEFVGSYGSNAYTKAESDAKHLVLEQRMTQHEQDINEQFEKHEEEVQEQIDTIQNILSVDVIIYAIKDEEGNVAYSSNYDDATLIDILINNTPQHIKYGTSLDDANLDVYHLRQASSTSYYFTTYDAQIHIRIDTTEQTISYSESVSGMTRTIDKRTPLITATISAYDETTEAYTISMESNGIWAPSIILNQFPQLSKLTIESSDYFSDNTFNTFDYIGEGVYKDEIQGVIYGNSKYEIVVYGSQTLYIFNKRQELEDKIDDYHVEVIVTGSNTETGGVSYTFSHTTEELIDIFTNKTPKHIKVSGDYFGTDVSATKTFTFSSTYFKGSRLYYYYTNLDEKVSILVYGDRVSVSIDKNELGESIESLETTVGNINSILDTLNGEVL